jgi:hypothetical protein
MYNYESALGSYPLGVSLNARFNGSGGSAGGPINWGGWGSLALVLPHIEGGNLYNAINFNLSPWNRFRAQYGWEANYTGFNTRVAAFLCPSDAKSGLTSINSYLACMGTSSWGSTTGDSTGMFSFQTPCYIASVSDGTSNTIVPPSSRQYPWNGCRFNGANFNADGSAYSNATSAHPGGANV